MLSEDDFAAIRESIGKDVTGYPVLVGRGGFRKMRYAPSGSGKGKSGGVRVICYYRGRDGRVSLATVIRKSESENLTKAERNQLAALAKELEKAP